MRTVVYDSLKKMCILFNRELSDDYAKTWEMALSSLSDNQIRYGFTRVLTDYNGTYIPTPAQFRMLATTEPGMGSIEDEAQLAWNELINTIKRYGRPRSIFLKTRQRLNSYATKAAGNLSVYGWRRSLHGNVKNSSRNM